MEHVEKAVGLYSFPEKRAVAKRTAADPGGRKRHILPSVSKGLRSTVPGEEGKRRTASVKGPNNTVKKNCDGGK